MNNTEIENKLIELRKKYKEATDKVDKECIKWQGIFLKRQLKEKQESIYED